MRITFMVGNGFDLGLGVKSSYGAFYDWYCQIPSTKTHVRKFKNSIMADMTRDAPDEEKTWADFELGLGAYTSNFTKETVDQFLECYEDAQEGIAEYLTKQEQILDLNRFPREAYDSFRRSIVNFYEEIPDGEKDQIRESLNYSAAQNREVTVISFNYTHSFERILGKIPDEPLATWRTNGLQYICKIKRNIIHVHGTTTAYPILGVNDNSQIANKELINVPEFKEMIVKTECVNTLGQLWHKRAEEQITNSQFVCVLGMSLGESDAKWWYLIAKWLTGNDKRHVIVYWYEKNPPGGVSIFKQIRCVNRVKNKLLSYSDLPDAVKEKIRDRIHVVINTGKFLQLKVATPISPKTKTIGDIAAVIR